MFSIYFADTPQNHPLATPSALEDAHAVVCASGLDGSFTTVQKAVDSLILERVELITACDACCQKVKAQYATFPSARASQAIAKCRKKHGAVRKGAKGASLKRWQKEKWKDKVTGKPCGHDGGPEYCRPSKKVSSKTPKTTSGEKLDKRIAEKRAGKRASAV